MEKTKKYIKNYIKYSDNNCVIFDEDQQCFKINTEKGQRKAKGLVPSLRKVFYENYKFEKAKYPKKFKGKRDKYGGLMRGSIVHHQLELWTNNKKDLRSQYLVPHAYTEKAIGAMEMWGMEPVISELAIADPYLMIATAIDMLCIDQEGKIILIEWKTGMDNYITRGTSRMNGPLDVSNCPLNQAYLQLLFGKMILEEQYGIKSDREYVMQIKEDGTYPFEIPSEFKRRKYELYNYFIDRFTYRKEQKQKSRFF